MARNKEDEDIEIPGEDDENEGDGGLKKKREKKRKSKEERIAERRVIFWTLLVILIITLGFWMMPKMGSILKGEPVWTDMKNNKEVKPGVEKKTDNKNYVEITL
jgi:hypothetical protein